MFVFVTSVFAVKRVLDKVLLYILTFQCVEFIFNLVLNEFQFRLKRNKILLKLRFYCVITEFLLNLSVSFFVFCFLRSNLGVLQQFYFLQGLKIRIRMQCYNACEQKINITLWLCLLEQRIILNRFERKWKQYENG